MVYHLRPVYLRTGCIDSITMIITPRPTAQEQQRRITKAIARGFNPPRGWEPAPAPAEHPYDPDELGYDPKPDIHHWHNTPIPTVNHPLPATPELIRIADRMWWNGDPWTILRNRYKYIQHALDNAAHEDLLYLWSSLPKKDWVIALKDALPGQVSTRSWRLWRNSAEIKNNYPPDPQWLEPRHFHDRPYYYAKSWATISEEKTEQGDRAV
ncbi:MAG: hypothetical protein OXD47_12470 [Gammaproteobacteria bacterium]|nr:hypothetical protein [Gammaproteobacteria bacterium]MCY4339583.1 hypothetical protein [Gammaproteobacteria bacterium]